MTDDRYELGYSGIKKLTQDDLVDVGALKRVQIYDYNECLEAGRQFQAGRIHGYNEAIDHLTANGYLRVPTHYSGAKKGEE